jgi:type IV secretion system protein VirB2
VSSIAKSNGVRQFETVAVYVLLGVLLMAVCGDVFADDATFKGACTKVSGFFKNFETILKVASVSIVTIAIVFAGYQIAFAHKRLSDVAPLLIGGLLIGGSSALASWFMAGWTTGSDCATDASTTSFLLLPQQILAFVA